MGEKDQGQALLFGTWADPDAALEKYFAERDDLTAGRGRTPPEGITVAEVLRPVS